MKQDPGDLNELTKLKENDGAVKAERRLLPNVNWVVKFQALELKFSLKPSAPRNWYLTTFFVGILTEEQMRAEFLKNCKRIPLPSDIS